MQDLYRELTKVVGQVWPDWEIAEPIGSGTFGVVFRASRKDRVPGEKDEAVKVIRIPRQDSEREKLLAEGNTPEQADRWFEQTAADAMSEIRTMSAVNGHTNIVNIHDYKAFRVPDSGVRYLLIRMELLDKIRPAGMCEADVIRLGIDVCTALSVCRKHNIVHRDISEDNVFLYDGNYKLGDFGVARVLEGSVRDMTLAGHPLYMAPEMYNGRLNETDIDAAARFDVYSLGILMYRLCNGMHYPFESAEGGASQAERNEAFRRRVINGEALPAPAYASEGLAKIILKACRAAPEERYAGAEEMKAALTSLQRAEAAAPREPEGKEEKAKKKRKRTAVILAVLLILVLSAVCIYCLQITYIWHPEETPVPTETPAPTEAMTPVPTEAPTGTPTQAPTDEPTQAPTEPPAASPVPTEPPAETETPAAAPGPTEENTASVPWPVLELNGKAASLRGSSRNAWYGPGKQYAEAGMYDPRLVRAAAVLFSEGDYVFTDVEYQTVGRKCVWFRSDALVAAGAEAPDLVPYPATVTAEIQPRFGPGAEYEEVTYNTTNSAGNALRMNLFLAKDAQVTVWLETKGWVLAEIDSPAGLIRAWIPASFISPL